MAAGLNIESMAENINGLAKLQLFWPNIAAIQLLQLQYQYSVSLKAAVAVGLGVWRSAISLNKMPLSASGNVSNEMVNGNG
jgi:hypothetical protein